MVAIGAAEGDKGEEDDEAPAQLDMLLPKPSPKKDRNLFYKNNLESLSFRKEPPAQQTVKEETKADQDKRAQLMKELEAESLSPFVEAILKQQLDALPKAKEVVEPEEPKEVEPATADKEASRLKIAMHTNMDNFRIWEQEMADAVAAKDVELQRLTVEKEKLVNHAKDVRQQNAVEVTEL